MPYGVERKEQPIPPEAQRLIEFTKGYMELQMYQDALESSDQALRIAPHAPEASELKGWALYALKQYSAAEPYWAAQTVSSEDPTVWVNLAYIRRRTTSLEAAIETLQQAFDKNLTDGLTHYNMACYHAVQGRLDEALVLLAKAFELDPEHRAQSRSEPDLNSLRQLPAFHGLMKGS